MGRIVHLCFVNATRNDICLKFEQGTYLIAKRYSFKPGDSIEEIEEPGDSQVKFIVINKSGQKQTARFSFTTKYEDEKLIVSNYNYSGPSQCDASFFIEPPDTVRFFLTKTH